MREGGIDRFDYVLVGGGLQNALVALAVFAARPEAHVALVERGRTIGGRHTWCFHAGDVPAEVRAVVEPLVLRRWPAYDVVFPGFTRALGSAYAAVTTERLAEVVGRAFAARPGRLLLTGAIASRVSARSVELVDGRRLEGRLVIDARGPEHLPARGEAAWQKFLGVELALSQPLARTRPLLMDGCVPQTDGFRFFYTLPLDPMRVLVEDTYFSDGPELDRDALRDEVLAYAARTGMRGERIVREESGALPLPLSFDSVGGGDGALVAGYQGGWFHPTTGYSFPIAARLACHLASVEPEDVRGPRFVELASRHRRQLRFALLLNRLLFRACAPERRWQVFARFYRLPEPTIRRFYALETTATDRARIVCGRPPAGLSLTQASLVFGGLCPPPGGQSRRGLGSWFRGA